MALNLKKFRMINYDKLLELRCRIADGGLFKKKNLAPDEFLQKYPAKKKKRKKPQRFKVEIEDVSDGKL